MARDSSSSALREWLFLLVLPLAAYYVLHYSPINQKGMLDPYIYTGYINNGPDLSDRFGFTYYSVRFGFLLPSRVLTVLLGPQAGYFVLRYLLALVAGVPLYFAVKRHLSLPVAAVLYWTLLSSPYVARTLLWEYPDASGMPFLTAAISLILLEGRKLAIWDAVAGCCAAMAMHSNIFTVSVFAIFVVVYSGLWILYGRGTALLGGRLLLVASGVVVVTMMGSLYYWRTVGHLNIFYPTLQTLRLLSGGGLNTWRLTGADWTFRLYHVFVPVWLGLCCLSVIQWRGESFARTAIVSFGVSTTLFYYAHQFLLGGDTLQLHYYFSYLAPAVFLMLSVLCQHLWERARIHPAWLGIVFVSITTVPWVLQSFSLDFSRLAGFGSFLTLAALSLVIAAITRWRLKYSGTTMLASVALVAVTFDTGFMSYPRMVQSRLHPDSSELDVFRVALQFIQAVPKAREQPGKIVFWYDNSHFSSLDSVQSTYLWGYSRFSQTKPVDTPGHPYFGDWQKKTLQDPDVRYLVLLGESGEELKIRRDALTANQVAFRPVSSRELASGGYRVYFQLLELTRR